MSRCAGRAPRGEAGRVRGPIGYAAEMESSAERTCPSCSAPTQARQRWCLECGAEVRSGRRAALRSTVGIATTLAVLVGAGSAAGYTLLQEGKQPPPPATTVAQQPPPVATTPPAATQEPAPYTPPASTPPPTPTYTPPAGGGGSSGGAETGGIGGGTSTGGSAIDVPGNGSTTDGNTEDEPTPVDPTTVEPQLSLTDIALGAIAIAYAPDAAADVDLGDPSRVVDGTTRTAWETPASPDPAAPQGSGVYVDLASPETIRKLIVRTSTPGMPLEIYGARKGPPPTIVDPGWDHLATRASAPAEAKIKLPNQAYRYILVWIPGPPPSGGPAAISELSLLSLQPE